MKRIAADLLLLVATLATGSGCGGPPNLAAVRANMAPEQCAVAEPIVDQTGLVLVPIPAGDFLMGYSEPPADPTAGENKPKKRAPAGQPSEQPAHRVTISQPFYLSVCEVTQGQFEAVTGRAPWRDQPVAADGSDYAASYISWDDAVEFAELLTTRENATYRLPTEAEWEYACRAGTTGSFHFEPAASADEYLWHKDNAYDQREQYPHKVGQKQPNHWALCDMHGNVWEWCSDWYAPYPDDAEPRTDPTGSDRGRARVWRGGSFADMLKNTRSETRLRENAVDARPLYLAGFRVVRELESCSRLANAAASSNLTRSLP